MTINALFETWITARAFEIAPRTSDHYRDIFRRYISPTIGALERDSITPEDAIAAITRPAAEGHARTALAVQQLLSLLLPGLRIPRPRYQARNNPHSDSSNLHILLTNTTDPALYVCYALAGIVALRRGEICALTWDAVLAPSFTISTQRTQRADGRILIGSPKSTSSRRTIDIGEDLREVFLEKFVQLSVANKLPIKSLIWPYKPASLNQHLQRDIKRLGIPPLTIHGLRHTAATIAINNGVDVHVLQALLGHSSVSVTASVYAHVEQASVTESISTVCGKVL